MVTCTMMGSESNHSSKQAFQKIKNACGHFVLWSGSSLRRFCLPVCVAFLVENYLCLIATFARSNKCIALVPGNSSRFLRAHHQDRTGILMETSGSRFRTLRSSVREL